MTAMGYRPKRGRNVGLVRVLRLARYLEGQRFLEPSLHMLAAEFGVHPRTIRRDLHALEEAGWPVPQFRQRPWEMAQIRHARLDVRHPREPER
jgi:hypothetical protein